MRHQRAVNCLMKQPPREDHPRFGVFLRDIGRGLESFSGSPMAASTTERANIIGSVRFFPGFFLVFVFGIPS